MWLVDASAPVGAFRSWLSQKPYHVLHSRLRTYI